MREMLSCLDFFCRGQGGGNRQLLQCGRNASIALYNSVYFIVFFGSRGFLVPRRAGATRVSRGGAKGQDSRNWPRAWSPTPGLWTS